MRPPLVRAAVLVPCAVWALACQSAPPSAPEAPTGAAGALGLSVAACDGQPATHVLTPGGPGTNGNWFFGTGGKDVIVGTEGNDKIDGGAGADRICLLGGDDRARGGAGRARIASSATWAMRR